MSADRPDPSPTPDDAPCIVCQEPQTEAYVQKDGYAFRRCPACGYVFCHPRPSQQDLAAYYGAEVEGVRPIDADHYPKASSRKRRGFSNAFKLLPHVFGKRVMDVGCGGGFVTGGMKVFGARQAVGIDIAESSIRYARAHFPKCDFHAGTIEDFLDGSLGLFDFVYSSEVIEHVVDVEAYMRFLALVTKPGAKVFITTPDIASAQVPADVTAWNVFSPPEHIQFFTQDTLAKLFARYGFAVVKRIPDRRGAGLKMMFRKTA